jgi:hypothetical protein
MPCKNPIKLSTLQGSPVHIPTAINTGFSMVLLAIFAYIHRDRGRVIRGSLSPAQSSGATTPSAPLSNSAK